MAIVFDGASQYITLNRDPLANSRPVSVAVLFETAQLGALDAAFYASHHSDTRGWGFEREGATQKLELRYCQTSPTAYSGFSAFTIPANSGTWLAVAVLRDVGASSTVDFYAYQYKTRTWYNSSDTGLGDVNPGAYSAGPYVGAYQGDEAQQSFFPGALHWLGIWARDLSAGGQARPALVLELAERGAWRLANGAFGCRLFLPFSVAFGLRDWSGLGNHGVLVGGASWAGERFSAHRPATGGIPWPMLQVKTRSLTLPERALGLGLPERTRSFTLDSSRSYANG